MGMPARIMVTYDRQVESQNDHGHGESPELLLMRMFDSLGYDHYMTHDRDNPETSMPERSLEFWERF